MERLSHLEHTIQARDELIDKLQAEIAEHCCETTLAGASSSGSGGKCVAHDRRKDRSVSNNDMINSFVVCCSKVSPYPPIEWPCVNEQRISFNVSLIRWPNDAAAIKRTAVAHRNQPKNSMIDHHRAVRRSVNLQVVISHRQQSAAVIDQSHQVSCRDCATVEVRQRRTHPLPNSRPHHRRGMWRWIDRYLILDHLRSLLSPNDAERPIQYDERRRSSPSRPLFSRSKQLQNAPRPAWKF